MDSWQRLDAAGQDEARALLRTCCGSTRWVDEMLQRRPFGSQPRLLSAARDVWFALSSADWREAFGQHPRIGDRESLRRRFAATRQLSDREQSGLQTASETEIAALEQGNHAYETRFGFIFIIRASGRTAGEILSALHARLSNDPEAELRVAAAQQAEITELRLLGLAVPDDAGR